MNLTQVIIFALVVSVSIVALLYGVEKIGRRLIDYNYKKKEEFHAAITSRLSRADDAATATASGGQG